MLFRLIAIVLLALSASSVFAEEPLPATDDPGTYQSDMYYNAMLRSIDLDTKRWKSFSRSIESGPWFYDTQRLKRNGTKVTVMVTVFPHPQKTEIYKTVYSDHTKIREIVFETEINCKKHLYRQPLIRVYGYYNELLTERSNTNHGFSSIRQSTTIDTLRSMICGPDKKKRHR